MRRTTILINTIVKNSVRTGQFPDEKLNEKIIDIFTCLGIAAASTVIDDCHRLGKANPANTIIRFVNRKFCYQALEKKSDLHKLDSDRLDFKPVKKLYFRHCCYCYSRMVTLNLIFVLRKKNRHVFFAAGICIVY